MIAASVVLCPPFPGEPDPLWRKEIHAALLGWSIPSAALSIPLEESDLDDRSKRAHWVAQTSLALAAESLPTPMVLVLGELSAHSAPALGFSQRASRRGVAGYVLIDPVLPEARAGLDWPDAPVTVFVTPAMDEESAAAVTRAADLRGFEVVAGDPADLLIGVVRR